MATSTQQYLFFETNVMFTINVLFEIKIFPVESTIFFRMIHLM